MDKFGNISPFNGYGASRVPMIKKPSPVFDLADNINAQDCDFGKFLKTAASKKKAVKRSKSTSKRATGRSKIKGQSKSKNSTVQNKVKSQSKTSKAKAATPRTPKRRRLSISSNEDISEYEQSNSSSRKRKAVSKPSTSIKRVVKNQPHKAKVPCLDQQQQDAPEAEAIPINPVFPAAEPSEHHSERKSVKFNSYAQDNDGNSLPCGEAGKWKKIRMYQERARKRELRKKRERARKRSRGKKTSKSKKRPRKKATKKSKKRGTGGKRKRKSKSSTKSRSGTRRKRKASSAKKGGRRSAK